MSFFTQFPVLQTERLILRQLRYDDGAQIHAYFTEELAKYYDWWPGPLRMVAVSYASLRQAIKTNSPSAGITLKPEDKVIGTCGFSDFDHFSKAELGYELSMEHWHKGLMFEALQAIIPFGFGRWKCTEFKPLFFRPTQPPFAC